MFDWLGLIESCRKAADVDVAGATAGELFDAARRLGHVRALVEAAESRVLATLEATADTDIEAGMSTSAWLARETGLARSTASRRVRRSVVLERSLPETHRRLIEGLISPDHAAVMADAAANPRVGDQVPMVETELLDLAALTVFEHWRQRVNALIELLDQDGGHNPADDDSRNRLQVTPLADGAETQLRGVLVGDVAEIARQSIEAGADELFHRHRRDRELCPELPVLSRATLRALALAEICRRAAAVDLTTTAAPTPEVSLIVGADDPNGDVSSPEGVRLADDTVRVLLCDAAVHPIVVGSLGVPLDMGRAIRNPNRAQRRALAHRDGGCAFPGCDSHVNWADAHHVDWWARDLGRTDVHRMILLCRHHHRVVHRTGWTVHESPDGWHYLQTPRGHTVWTQRHHRQRAGPAPPPPP